MDFNDIIKDPKKYGAPTFEEYCADPEKWRGRADEVFSTIDNQKSILRDRFNKIIYKINGYECKTIEKVQSVAMDMGIEMHELDYKIQLIPQGGGECDVLIEFVHKAQGASWE